MYNFSNTIAYLDAFMRTDILSPFKVPLSLSKKKITLLAIATLSALATCLLFIISVLEQKKNFLAN